MNSLFNLGLNKNQLNIYSSVIGFLGAAAVILGQFEYIPARPANCFGAIASLAVAYLVQQPAGAHPTTEEAEEEKK